MNKKKQGAVLLALVAAFVACLFAPSVANAAEAKSMYRLYNQWTGEHLYTADANERKQLVAVGWTAEGDAWDAPAKSSTPVWRLYNPYVPGGDHHYTKDKAEYDALKKAGWRQEGLAWYSDDARGEALFRLYNPYAQTGTHHYTVDTHERNELAKLGWNYEGIAWYGVSSGPEYDYTLKSGVKSYSNYDWLGASSYVVRQTSSAPKVGDKIVIDPTDENPFGAAGTITSVSRRSDGSYSVSIKQATDPSEVFTDIEVKQSPVEADRDKAVVSGASGASGGGVDLSGDWEPEGDAFGASFDVDLGSGSYAKGGFSIKPTIGYDIKWTIFGGLERCELSVGGKVDLDVETHVQNKNAGKDVKVFEASVPIAYGFSVDLPLYVHISAEGDLTLAVDYEMDTTMSLVNGKWVPFDHSDFDAELSAAVHLRLGGKVGAELKWLQVQLVDAAVGAGADGTAKTTIRSAGLTCADLSAYMYLDVEIGKGTDYLKKLGWTLDKEILNASNSPLKLALHFENGNRVPECTWGKEDEKPSEPEEPSETTNLFATIPSKFVFSSGAGAWSTVLTLRDDGSFTGQYHDSDAGEIGPGYPNGTRYICNFSGTFDSPTKVKEYVYSTRLKSFATEGTLGEEYIEDGIRFVVSDAYGMLDADEFLIYLPGCPLDDMAEDFVLWNYINGEIRDTVPMGVCGIFNVGGESAFIGEDEDSLWGNDYCYSYGTNRSELWPSYFGKSHLVFWPKTGASTLDLAFEWKTDDQSEFIATDARGTGEYRITIQFEEDYSMAKITVKSMSGFNLTPWGGTEGGVLSAEYRIK